MAEYTIKTSSKFTIFYDDDNAEVDPDALLQKIAEEKALQVKEKVNKPKIVKSDKLKVKVEPIPKESNVAKVEKKEQIAEKPSLKSPDKQKFDSSKQDARPPRFANKRGGADQQQNKENITSSTDDWGTSGGDWGTSGSAKVDNASTDNQAGPDDWTTSGFQRSGVHNRGAPGAAANRRGGGFGEFNGPRAPRNFEGRGEFRGRGRGNFRGRGGFQSTDGAAEIEKPSDFGDDAIKSEDQQQQQSFGQRGGYRGGRGGFRRDDGGEGGGEYRPRGRGRGGYRGRGGTNTGATDEGFGGGANVTSSFGNNEEWGTSEVPVDSAAPIGGDSFGDQQQPPNFGRGRRNFGAGGLYRGGRGGRGNYGRGREFDRHSGSDRTGVKSVDRKDGAGTGNWGTAEDELKGETDPTGLENIEAPTTWDAEEGHDDKDKAEKAAAEPALMTLDEYKAKKKLQDAAALEQLRSAQVNTDANVRAVNEGFNKDDAFKNMYEYRKAKEESEDEEGGEQAEDKDAASKPASAKTAFFDFKFNDNNRRGGGGGEYGGGRGGRGGRGGFERSGRGGAGYRGGRGGGRGNREDGEGGSHAQPAANMRLTDDVDFPTLKGN